MALYKLDNLMCDPILPVNYATIIATWVATWDHLFLTRDNVTYFNKVHIANVHLKVSRVECSQLWFYFLINKNIQVAQGWHPLCRSIMTRSARV